MKSMEGVRRVTNRMELIQGLRSKLLKARLASMIFGFIIIGLVGYNYKLSVDLKAAQAENQSHIRFEETLKSEINELKTEVKDLKTEIDRLNSFDNKIAVAFELEDIVREAVGGIESVTKTLRHYVSSRYSIKTDIEVVDYVLDETTGETVKVIEDTNHMFVVYVADSETSSSLEQELTKQYYRGTERYADIISSYENTLLVRHDYK